MLLAEALIDVAYTPLGVAELRLAEFMLGVAELTSTMRTTVSLPVAAADANALIGVAPG